MSISSMDVFMSTKETEEKREALALLMQNL
jgi:hypothetical protein